MRNKWAITDVSLTTEGNSTENRVTVHCRGMANYKAPELVQGVANSGSFTNKVDIWAMGCILYHIVFGINAFTSEEALHKYCKTGGESLNLQSKYEELLIIFVTKELAEFISVLILDMLKIEGYARPAAREILKDLDVQLGA